MPDDTNDHPKHADRDHLGDQLRAESVWLLGHVILAAWFFFSVFYWFIGHQLASSWCTAQALAYLVTFTVMRKSKAYQTTMNLFLGFTMVGVVGISAIEPAASTSIYFAPFATLVASQLFGNRQGRSWMIYSMFAMVTFFGIQYSIQDLLNHHLIELTLGLVMCVSVYLICRQFELHYQRKTQSLVSFSESLQIKSEELRKLATTDSLTHLTNRYQLKQQLEASIDAAKNGEPFAIFLVDMDGFKEINDTMGHSVGDRVLVEIGLRLSNRFGDFESIARLGGDEFCLIAKGVDSELEAEQIAHAIFNELTKKYYLAEREFALGASIGLALCPKHSLSSNDILAFADTAMYHAKNNNIAVGTYSIEMTKKLVENSKLKEQLSDAIAEQQFFLVFQPQVCLTNGTIVGAEALLRWNNNGQIISPARFIPLLEQTGLIDEVGQWIMEDVCRQKSLWREAGIDLKVAVNISAVQFESDQFIESILEPIRRWGLESEGFDLEITESLLIGDVDSAVRKLVILKQHGLSISIDDFGTGYSSLSYLRQFPIDKLKIDRAFVKDIPHYDDGALVASITTLGHVMGMEVLVEGVETDAQLELVKELKCDAYQGYFFSKPIEAQEMTAMLVKQQHSADQARQTPLCVANIDPHE